MSRFLAGLLALLALVCCTSFTSAEEIGPQFPFAAQTNELAVNLRLVMDSDGEAVGRLERGQELTVLEAFINDIGEVWYSVQLEDGTSGYIRSDLLIPSEQIQAEIAQYLAANDKTNGAYIGNIKSKKFHLPTCRTLPKETNRVNLQTREEAIEKGYDPCGNCHP